jgi:polysaccharide biosynthesis/export protein
MPAEIEIAIPVRRDAPHHIVRHLPMPSRMHATTIAALLMIASVPASIMAAAAQITPTAPEAGSELDPAFLGRYRLTATDVLELIFPYVPEFNQELTVQPDGYVTLKDAGELRVQGRTIPELRTMFYEAYERILRDPVITIVLKEFEKPYFVAAGAVNKPGKIDLRGATTVTQAIALAGGISGEGKASQVLVFRRFSADLLEVKEINVKAMFSRKDLSEDPLLRPGDTLFVPNSVMARIERYIARPQLGLYLNPLQPFE